MSQGDYTHQECKECAEKEERIKELEQELERHKELNKNMAHEYHWLIELVDNFINVVDKGDFELEIGIHYAQFKKDMGYTDVNSLYL